jgi:hypothetical protein
MSATLTSLRTWKDRTPDGTTYHADRTPVATVNLRDVSREQGQALGAAQARHFAPTRKPTAHELYAQIDAALANLPTGFYALPKREDATNGNRPFYFFKIHPFRGDRKRIVMVTGGVGAFTEVPMKVLWQLRAAQGIAKDVAGAAALFGKETNTCGFCAAKGRTSPLTHPRSVAAGYGKDCAELHGLPW